MSNMSYCRFRNTRHDLTDCFEALNDYDHDELSENEASAAVGMLIDMVDFLEDKGIISDIPSDYKEDIRSYIDSFRKNNEYEED